MSHVFLILSDALRYDAPVAEWMECGYTILVTHDHGINADKLHGDTTPEVREVPLYRFQPDVPGRGDSGEIISQLQIAPTICKLMGLTIPDTMRNAPIV